MINKDDYKLSLSFLERTKLGIKHFHFQIDGPSDETLYFYSFEGMSGFKRSYLNDPIDYILFGTLLLLLKDELKKGMRQHYKDVVSPLQDHMKEEPKRKRKDEKKKTFPGGELKIEIDDSSFENQTNRLVTELGPSKIETENLSKDERDLAEAKINEQGKN